MYQMILMSDVIDPASGEIVGAAGEAIDVGSDQADRIDVLAQENPDEFVITKAGTNAIVISTYRPAETWVQTEDSRLYSVKGVAEEQIDRIYTLETLIERLYQEIGKVHEDCLAGLVEQIDNHGHVTDAEGPRRVESNVQIDNRCGMGYCSKGFTGNQVKKCTRGFLDGWNGECSFQRGHRIYDGQREIRLDCCKTGCNMLPGRYAAWNGLCSDRGT